MHDCPVGRVVGVIGCLLLLVVSAGRVQGAEPVVSFSSPERAALFEELTREFRCLKCQNQNLADSNAALASDLRQEIRLQVEAGKGRDEIAAYLVARYGDFVLYRPPFKRSTWALWVGPFVLLLIGIGYALVLVRRHRHDRVPAADNADTGDYQRLARGLLDEPSASRDAD